MKKLILILALFALANMASAVTTIVDPNGSADFTTIQAAITASSDGYTVVVMPGTYYENINMLGRAITLQSSDPNDSVVVISTIIDGNDLGSVIICNNSEDPNTVINGFVITNGFTDGDGGGGMYNLDSSPTVMNCTFSRNSATTNGGGMYNEGSSLTVMNCTFSGNISGDAGGGMYNVYSFPTVTNCTFSGNIATTYGGGMYNAYAFPTVSDCTFRGNTANNGGGMYSTRGSSPPVVTDCVFSWNIATNRGGGMYNSLVALPITNCTFSGNTATASGGGMFNTGKLPIIDNNYFCGNTPEYIYGPHTDEGTNTFYTYCPPPQPIVEGDLTGDGKVDMFDLAELAANWLAGT